MDPLVTVVVPVYGVEAYLSRCVDSLLGQSFANLEIILVNDGSPDRSGILCDAYAEQDPRVKVIHQENSGLSSARNRGIDAACGEYLTFVDSDDWVHDEYVKSLLSDALEFRAEVSACRFVRCGENDSLGTTKAPHVRLMNGREALALYGGPEKSLMTSACAKLFHVSILKDLRFPVGRFYEDEYTTWRLLARSSRVTLSSANLYCYFVRPTSITQRTQGTKPLLDRLEALQEQSAYFRSIDLSRANGSNLKRTFLIERQIRKPLISDRPAIAREVHRGIRETASLLRASDQSLSLKIFATTYALVPQPLDLAIAALQKVKRVPPRTPKPGPTAADSDGDRDLEIVVVAYGSPELLRSALEPVVSYPITVVDNSSLPAIRELSAELGCRYIDPERNGGFAAGVNIGLANLENPENDVLLLNPDAVIRADDVERLHAALRADPGLASVGPRQVEESGTPIRVAWPFPSPLGTWLDAVGLSRLRPRGEYVSGAILLLRAEAIADVGPFDERFFLYAEEADWQYRARLRGWRHQVIESVTAMHAGGATSSDERKRQTHFHASHERFLRKHHGPLGWQAARLGQLAADLIRAALRSGTDRERLLARSALYLRGPMRAEELLRPRADAGPTHS